MRQDNGLMRRHGWAFVIADISFIILASGFLSYFNMDVSVRDLCLNYNVTSLAVLGLQSSRTSSGVYTF